MSLKRLWPLALTLLLLVGVALPVHADALIVFKVPQDRATVKSPVVMDLAIPAGIGPQVARLDVAHGANALSGFITVALNTLQMPDNPNSIRGYEWDATGFSPGIYTLHFMAIQPQTGAVLGEGTVNVTLDGPDYSPQVHLKAPASVGESDLIDSNIVDTDLAGWRLDAVDSGGVVHPVESGGNVAPSVIKMKTGNLTDGTYTLRLTAWDRCGNQVSAEQTVVVSTPAPVLQLGMASVDAVQTKLPIAYKAALPVQIAVSVMGDGGRVVAEGNAQGQAGDNTVDVPVNLRGLKPGRYSATVAIKDLQGRLSTGSLDMIVREPGPTAVMAEFPAYVTGDFSVKVAFPAVDISYWERTTTDAGGSMVVRVPAPPQPGITVSYPVSPVREGRLTYRITLHLADGRITDSEERVTTVDLRPPTLGDVSVANVDGLGLNMRWEPATDTVGIKGYDVILVEGGAERVLASLGPEATAYAVALPEGEYAAALTAVDLGGHRVTSPLHDFRVQAGAVALMRAGKLLPADVPGFAEDGRTWVPLRLFGEALGYKVSWDQATQTATIVDEQSRRTMLATVGQTRLRIQEPAGERVVEVPAAPRLVGGRVQVPLRALAEALGAEVTWHQETRTVELK